MTKFWLSEKFNTPFLGKSQCLLLFLSSKCIVLKSRRGSICLYLLKQVRVVIYIIKFFSSVHSVVQLFATPWTETYQASLFITIFRSLLKLIYIHSVMPSKHFILCCPLLSLPSIYPSIRLFSNETALFIKWPKYWNFSFSISPFYEYSGLI